MNGNRKYLIRTILISSAIAGGSLLNINSASAAPGPKPIVRSTPPPAPAPKPAPIPMLIAKPTPPPTSPPPPTKVAELPSFMPWTVTPAPSPGPKVTPSPVPQVISPAQKGLSTLNKIEIGVIATAATVALVYSIAEITVGVTIAAAADVVSSLGQGGVVLGVLTTNSTLTYTSGIIASIGEVVNRVMK